MNELFTKYNYWKILAFFLKRPSTEVYIKELSRILSISPASANSALKYMHKLKIFLKKKRGPAHYYGLNNDSVLVQSLKRTFVFFVLEDMSFSDLCAEAEPNLISLAIYGSFANGTFDEKSDFDLLAVGGDKSKLAKITGLLEKKIGHEINIEHFSVSGWQKLKNTNDIFYKEVIRNHILLIGVPLI